jgi:hypothetical protein
MFKEPFLNRLYQWEERIFHAPFLSISYSDHSLLLEGPGDEVMEGKKVAYDQLTLLSLYAR